MQLVRVEYKWTLNRSPLPLLVKGAFDGDSFVVLGPFKPSNRQNRYIMVFKDYLTQWWEAFISIKASVIARFFVDEAVAQHGAPTF